MLPLALAVLALFIGGAGLYFGLDSTQRLAALEESNSAAMSDVARATKQLDKTSTRLDEIAAESAEVRKTVDRMRVYGSQTEQGLKKVVSEVNANREQILKNAQGLSDLIENGARPVRAAPAAAPVADSGGSSGPADGAMRLYRIQSGDTFQAIASKMGVSLQAVLDANPGVDPRRLAIGQEIKIPAN